MSVEQYKEEADNEVFMSVARKCVEYMKQNEEPETKVSNFKTPAELREIFDFEFGSDGLGLQGLDEGIIDNVLKYGVRTGHVRFMNQLWAGTDKAAVAGEWLTAVMNTSMYMYEVSPVFTMMEMQIMKKMFSLIGWNPKTADGVFAPGGANCNLLAVLAARNNVIPDSRMNGVTEPICLFTSVASHYTIKRGASVVGAGINGCILVETNDKGCMIPAKLDEAIAAAVAAGKKPFMVNATCGTTVLGAYEDINGIADVCEKYKVWFHIDAAWGGHCLLSKKHRHLMNGCERADSITWTATKCFGLPQQCSALLVKSKGELYKCNSMQEDYLFHDSDEKDCDLGDRTLNCGIRNDALKLWLAWKAHGDNGMEAIVDHAFDQAQYVVSELKKRPDSFRLLVEPESLNVCFWYLPNCARGLEDSPEKFDIMDKATLTIRRTLQVEGKCLFNYSDLKGVQGHFFRLITCNPGASPKELDFLISEVERIGADL
eukprot:TRINITY_DN212_c0_g6_i1.p1 TRINITY_DN212_c0_g6~~TRINITY_DN212_c0_g6_i1.p1  ORF type:complete len:504 (+),score=164.86 TRINITY_DN212_c0_g6_i1:52-1512(+)